MPPKPKSPATPSVPSQAALDLMAFLPNRLAVLSRLTQQLLAAELESRGMTIAHWRVYLCLVQQGPSTLNEISAFTKLPQSSLSRSVAKMDERGWVLNKRNAEDRRISEIEITEEGRAQLDEAIEAIDALWARTLNLSDRQQADLLRTVNALIGRLEA